MLQEATGLAKVAIFGTLSESYRTCGHEGCRCHGDGPKHGPHLHISYRGAEGKTTGYYVPKTAEAPIRAGVAAWSRLLVILRKLAELNKDEALRDARTDAHARRGPAPAPARSRRRGPRSGERAGTRPRRSSGFRNSL
jgi:hypothetical protein